MWGLQLLTIISLVCATAAEQNIPGVTCKATKKGVDYHGTLSVTRGGKKCQNWSSNSPHRENYRPSGDAKNYCRNPQGSGREPWCYTTDPNTRFDYCDVPNCPVCDAGKYYNAAKQTCQPVIQTANFADSKVLYAVSSEIKQNFLHLVKGNNGYWYKCYTGSENSFSAPGFHNACDNKGPTLVVVRVGKRVFGGFSAIPYNAANPGWQKSKAAYLFQANSFIKMYASRQPQYSINNYYGHGPLMGAGWDFYLCDNAGKSKCSYTNPGLSYQLPSGYTYNSTKAQSIMATSKYFKVTEYEAYYYVANPCKTTCGSATCNMRNHKPVCSCGSGRYFNAAIKSCKNVINTANFADSKVLSAVAIGIKQNFLHLVNGNSGHWKKCFTASENAFSSRAFHSACDKKGPTITIVRVGNRVFGGYSSKSYNAALKNWQYSRSAYLFQANSYIKMASKQPDYSVYSDNTLGPLMGSGWDFYLCNNAGKYKCSFTNPGYSFQLPSGYTKKSPQAQSLMAGSEHFYVNEYEVYYHV